MIWLVLLFIFYLIYKFRDSFGIYTKPHIIYRKGNIYFDKFDKNDIVFIRKYSHFYDLYFLFNNSSYTMLLQPIPASHKLVHHHDGHEKEIHYEKHTPFRVHHGTLHLKKKMMKNRSIVYETVQSGNEWPFPYSLEGNPS